MLRRILFMAVVLGVGVLFTPTQAQAAFQVKVVIGANTYLIDDGDPGGIGHGVDSNGATNAITAVIIDSGISVTVSTAITNTPGDASGALLDLTYTASSFGGAGGTVTMWASATGFQEPPAVLNPLTLISHLGGTGTNTFSITGQQWVDTNNVLYGISQNITPGVHGPFTSSPYSDDLSTSFSRGAGAFSLTERVIITLGSNSLATGDLQSTVPVPAPAGLLLALSGMPVFGVGAWLRRRSKKA